MENINSTEYIAAQERVLALKRFYRNLLVFAVVSGAFLLYNYWKHGFVEFRPSFWILIWAVVLTVKGIKLFVLNYDWEKRQLQKELEKNV